MPRTERAPAASLLAWSFAALAALLLIVLLYHGGLGGGFLLDDLDNLGPLERYARGEVGWQSIVFGNRSGPLGRPLSMASFALDTHLWGFDARAFNRTALGLHLACALLVGLLAHALGAREAGLAPRRRYACALLVGLTWACLPVHVSTVLYPVQRMSVLAALGVLAALLCYVAGRRRLAAGEAAWAWLYLGFPLCTACAALAKESGLLAPLLAAALELGWFAQAATHTEQRARQRFFLLVLGLPALALALAAASGRLAPLFAPYAARDFTLVERLLSEARVLWDYLRIVALPFAPGMGLVHDDFVPSRGLLVPATTLAALLGWLAVAAVAWRLHRVLPAVSGGLAFFLAAHALEAGPLPLELYFEHRNYVASVGLVLAGTALARAALRRTTALRSRRLLLALLLLVPLAYAGATASRARLWGDPVARLLVAIEHNPASPRLRSQLAVAAARRGRLDVAYAHVEAAAAGPRPPGPRTLDLWRVLLACLARQPVDAAALARATAAGTPRITLGEMTTFDALAGRVEGATCPSPDRAQAHALGRAMLASSRQGDFTQEVWRTRYNVARLAAAAGRYDEAVAEAERAWRDSGWNTGIGILVYRLHGSRDAPRAQADTLHRLRAHADPHDHLLATTLARFGAQLAARGVSATPTP